MVLVNVREEKEPLEETNPKPAAEAVAPAPIVME
jgi:hypothetical protein